MFLRLIERVFVFLFFFYLMGTATALLYSDMDADSYLALQGSLHWPITLIQISLSLIGGFLILTRWRRVAAAALKAWPLLALAALQLLSAAWSIHPMLTVRKDVLELITLFIGIYLGERYTTSAFSALIAQVLYLSMIIVLVLLPVAPHFVLQADQHNALKGLAQHKNLFGFYIGLTVALLLLVRFKRFDWLRYFALPLALAMLLFSRSMTSVATAGIVLLPLPIWLLARLPAKQRVVGYLAAAAAFAAVVCLCVLFSHDLLALVGKDTTLTGRTQVWEQLIVAIRHRPILGYGYGAFWTGLSGESLDVLIAAGWIVPSAHNAYLELCIGLGVPGVIAIILIFWSAFRMAIEYIRMEPGWPGLWPIACILFIVVHGIGESEFIFDSSFCCCLFTTLYTSLALKCARGRRTLVAVPLMNQGSMQRGLMIESGAD